MRLLALRRLAMTCQVCTSQIFTLYCLTKCTYCMSSCSLKHTDSGTLAALLSLVSSFHQFTPTLVVLSGPYTQEKRPLWSLSTTTGPYYRCYIRFWLRNTFLNLIKTNIRYKQTFQIHLKKYLPLLRTWWTWFLQREKKPILNHFFEWHLTQYCSKYGPINGSIPHLKFCAKNIYWWWRSSYRCILAPVYCWTSVCLAEEKTLSRKCFPQLLGVSFPTLRPTKRQIAAKSRDSSAAEMPFGLIPALSKHSSHTCLPQWAGPFHLHQGNWLVKQHCLVS